MDEFEIVKHIMMLDHVSYDDLSKRLGYKSKANSYQILNKKNIYVSTLRKFLDALGYDIIICKKDKTGEGFVVTDDDLPSPLRFRDMGLNLESIFDSSTVETPKPGLTAEERISRTKALKKNISILTSEECDCELRKIWGIKDPAPKGKQPQNEFQMEYEKYRKEIFDLYEAVASVPTVVEHSHGTVEGGAQGADQRRRSILEELTPGFVMDD